MLNTYAAALLKVPVIFVSGDRGLCDDITALNPHIGTVAVKEGVGDSTISIHPDLAAIQIKEGMAKAMRGDHSKCLVTLPDHFLVDIQYKAHTKARVYSFYPGATQKDPLTVNYEHADYYEILRFLYFATA
jgi:D-amino peptidase